jgi:hypothetical protein
MTANQVVGIALIVRGVFSLNGSALPSEATRF